MVEWILVVVTAAGMQTASFSSEFLCSEARLQVLEYNNDRRSAECYENVWH